MHTLLKRSARGQRITRMRATQSRWAYLAALSLSLASCTSATGDRGLAADFFVEDAQYVQLSIPDLAQPTGPAIASLAVSQRETVIGTTRNTLRAALAPQATALVVGLAEADEAWIIAAGVPDAETPDLPSASARFGLRQTVSPAPTEVTLRAAAVADGVWGPATTVTLLAVPQAPPTGELVVSLYWNGAADLDLHVVDPAGGEAWSGDPNTYKPPPPGEPVDPQGYLQGGILTYDANANCRRDAVATESVVWTQPPPAGTYIVRVDTRAMCGAAAAFWTILVTRNGNVVQRAQGRSVGADELSSHRAGAGVTALTFTLP